MKESKDNLVLLNRLIRFESFTFTSTHNEFNEKSLNNTQTQLKPTTLPEFRTIILALIH